MKVVKIQPLIWWTPALAWAGWIFWMSSQSEVPETDFWLPPHFDKMVHVLIYAVLASLLYPALRVGGLSRWSSAWIAFLLASLYGMTDEWHQSMVANRTADIRDWVADTIGASTAFIVARHEEKWLPAWVRKFL